MSLCLYVYYVNVAVYKDPQPPNLGGEGAKEVEQLVKGFDFIVARHVAFRVGF